jgi:hypothetical protein
MMIVCCAMVSGADAALIILCTNSVVRLCCCNIHSSTSALQADFQPSDLLCPMSFCWVPHERVRAAVLASLVYTNLSAVPGALIGLGAAHSVGDNGQPEAPALQVAELDGTAFTFNHCLPSHLLQSLVR